MNKYIPNIINQLSLDINVNYVCSLHCRGCNRLLEIKQHPYANIKLEQVQSVINEAIEDKIKFQHIRLSGGEPTIHPNFLLLVEELKRYRNFSQQTELQLVTNGYSTLTKTILNKIENYKFNIMNSKKNGVAEDTKDFYSHFVKPSEVGQKSNNQKFCCDKPIECGLMLDYKGFYICHFAATVNMFFDNIKPEKNIQAILNKDTILNQMRVACEYCGHICKPKFPKDFMSPTWKNKLLRLIQ